MQDLILYAETSMLQFDHVIVNYVDGKHRHVDNI
jgi:hypothetical protein